MESRLYRLNKTKGFPPVLLAWVQLSIVLFPGCVLNYKLQDGSGESASDSLVGTENDVRVDSVDTDVSDGDTTTDTFVHHDTQDNSATFCQEAEENGLVVFECGSGGIIDRIDFASFGQYEGSCALGGAEIGKCHFDDTVRVIETECLGRSICQLIADKKEVFGDPCKKGKHRLIVFFTCIYQERCPSNSLKPVPGKCGCQIPDNDQDGDGSADCNDECDFNPLKIEEGQCGCEIVDEDIDNDGVPGCLDECDKDENKLEPGICGCGKEDKDTGDRDGDGTIDCLDKCKDDPRKTSPGICGCNELDDPTDSDGDGKADCVDGCPSDPHKLDPGYCGCGEPERCSIYCEDTPDYRDPKGEKCSDWDNDCYLAWMYGYTLVETKEIQAYCPKSCGLCGAP